MYLISFGSLYVMFNIMFFIFFRKMIKDQVRKWIMVSQGYCLIRINKPNHHQAEYFKKPKSDKVHINDATYITDPKKIRYIGKMPVFEYKEGTAEPIDPYDDKLVGTDAEYLDGFLLKMKSLAKMSALKQLQTIYLLALFAAIGGIGAAAIAGYNWTMLDKLIKALIK